MTDSETPHLSQKSLEGILEIDKILQTFGKWLQRAGFENGKKEGTENCADADMPDAAGPLLEALGYSKGNSKPKEYNVLRIHGPNTTRIGLKADIIPIQVWGFDPTLDGEVLSPKTRTYIKRGVEVKVTDRSIVDLLIIASKEETKV